MKILNQNIFKELNSNEMKWNENACLVNDFAFIMLYLWHDMNCNNSWWKCWFDLKIRVQFQKGLTPLLVKIELLVPMCSFTPLLSCNQTIFSKKKNPLFR